MNRRLFLLSGAAALAVGPSSVLAIANTTWDAFDAVYDFGNAGIETEACMNLAPYLQSGFIARREIDP